MSTELNNLLDLQNKVAIVTGGAVGIGAGIAERLHQAGANVVIADVSEQNASNEAEKLNQIRPDSALAVTTDVSKKDSVDTLVSSAIQKFGHIDILVNNAGIFPSTPLAQMEEADFMKVIDVNLRGVFLTTKAVSTQMISQGNGGKIINITSIDALHPSMVGLAHYDASKHGLWGFTKNVAIELAEHKIWVNSIAPGGISTPGAAAMQDPSKMPAGVDMQALTNAFLARIPMHRMGEPDEIGKVALFLASDMSSYMTGSQIVVDGGALLG
ncbi:SDR family oxidoreductase [Candidatus Saccharibacteria bacterium]|nr:SDR family oxidoreductase [Candidatus Saccharibacteria bacterium]